MVQHVNGVLYTDKRIANSTLWTVAAFVILGGYNIMSSYRRNGYIDVKKKLSSILIPYIFCTCIYVIWQNHFLNVEVIWQRLIHFNAAGPLYFVAVYIQLVIVSPLLAGFICWAEVKNEVFRHSFVLIIIFGVSYLSIHYTDIFGISLGGGNLFSGFWLIFWYGGMLFEKKKRDLPKKTKELISGLLFVLCLLWEYIFVFRDCNNVFRSKYGNMFHMTAQMTWLNALQAFMVVAFFKEFIECITIKENKVVVLCLKPICYIGRMSLPIFMYHILFRDIFFAYFPVNNIWICRIMCFAFMIGGSILVSLILRRIKDILWSMLQIKNING